MEAQPYFRKRRGNLKGMVGFQIAATCRSPNPCQHVEVILPPQSFNRMTQTRTRGLETPMREAEVMPGFYFPAATKAGRLRTPTGRIPAPMLRLFLHLLSDLPLTFTLELTTWPRMGARPHFCRSSDSQRHFPNNILLRIHGSDSFLPLPFMSSRSDARIRQPWASDNGRPPPAPSQQGQPQAGGGPRKPNICVHNNRWEVLAKKGKEMASLRPLSGPLRIE